MLFLDRQDAGQQLANKLTDFKNKPNTVILGLPRGGVVVAAVIAKQLALPLDIIIPRKIGAPTNPELAIGAITEDGQMIINQPIIDNLAIPPGYINQEANKQKHEAIRRLKLYREDRQPLNLKNRTVILVDDGVATGATMRAAILSVKNKKASQIILAAPVIAYDTLQALSREVDQVIYLDAPFFFGAVGAFYQNFAQTSDEEVIGIMRETNDIKSS